VKIQTFTRTISALYSVCLMNLFLRVQVNILGRYLYLNSSGSSSEEEVPITAEIQQKYLAFADHFVERGVKDLTSFLQEKVEAEMASWPLTKQCGVEDLLHLLKDIRNRIEPQVMTTEGNHKNGCLFYEYLLPSEENSEVSDKFLKCLLNESRDVLESDKFSTTMMLCAEKGFATLENQLREAYSQQGGSAIPQVLPMPKIFPLVKKEFSVILDGQGEHSLLQSLFGLKELEQYSYYIFTSSYDEN